MRGLGCVPDPPDHHDKSVYLLGLGSPVIPRETSFRGFVPRILDQGNTESCVANAVALAWATVNALAGREVAIPSRLALYWWARHQHGATKTDSGTYCRAGVKALSKHGAPPESSWPFDATAVGKKPPLRVVQAGFRHRGPAGYYRIFDDGKARLGAVQRALASRIPMIFGVSVDDAFTSDSGPEWIPPRTGARVGGHAMMLTGYAEKDGEKWYQVVNSWGARWRGDGTAFLHGSWVEEAWDLWALSL